MAASTNLYVVLLETHCGDAANLYTNLILITMRTLLLNDLVKDISANDKLILVDRINAAGLKYVSAHFSVGPSGYLFELQVDHETTPVELVGIGMLIALIIAELHKNK